MQTFHCLDCDKDFKAGSWLCESGAQHRVETKRYFTDDAPTVPEWRNGHPFINKGASRTQVLNIPPEKQIREGEQTTRIPGGSVEFIRGMYETDDPEKQFWLDKKSGWVTEERWKEVYLNDDERLQLREMALNARETQLASRENDLLGKEKKRVSA